MPAANAQTHINTEWVQSTGQPENIPWTATAIDGYGNIIVVGNTQTGPGNADVLITKYDRYGELLWQETFAGSAGSNDYGVAVMINIAGDIFVAATVTNTGSAQDIVVLKYNAQGSLQWDSARDGPSSLADVPAAMAADSIGNIYVCGATWTSPSFTDYALVKFDANGDLQWSGTYDHAGLIDAATSIRVDGDGHPIITGGSASAIAEWDYAILRYHGATGAGMDTLRVSLPGVGLDNALAMSLDEAGNAYITGYRDNNGDRDIQTIKIGQGFELEWAVDHGTTGETDAGQAVAADAAGNVYVCGYMGNGQNGSVFLTLKYDPDGNPLWARRHKPQGGNWPAQATKLVVSADSGVVVTGTVSNGQRMNFSTVKYGPDGSLKWAKDHDAGYGDDKALALLMEAQGILYVSGLTEGPGGQTYTTVKYEVYEKDDQAVLDSLGNPLYLKNEVIVKFRSHLVDTTFVDNRNLQHTTLDRLLPDSVADAVAAKLGLPPGHAPRIKVCKVFRRWTRADSISISRLGEEVRLPRLWSVFVIGTNGMDPLEAADSLKTLHQAVAYAHSNSIFQFHTNDPIYYEDWQSSLSPTTEYPDAHINIEPAWAIQTGQPFIKVGIVDSPVNWDHEDFVHDGSTKVLNGYDHRMTGIEDLDTSIPYTSYYNSGEGFHGTACASIVGSLRNNEKGATGIAGGDVKGTGTTGTSIVPLVVGSYITQSITLNEASEAIVDGSSDISITENGFGCHVLNFSWGASASAMWPDYPLTLVKAILVANRNHCTITAAHGNHGVGQSTFRAYPAAFAEHPDGPFGLVGDDVIISVGATGDDGRHLFFESNNTDDYPFNACHHFGLDIAAPGSSSNVYTALGGLEPGLNRQDLPWETFGFPQVYSCSQGTSSAAPHAAGVAALMLAEHSVINGAPNGLAPEDIEQILQSTATDIFDLVTEWPPYEEYHVGYDDYHGHGRLDAGVALALVSEPYFVVHSGDPVSVNTQQYPPEVITVPPWNLLELPPGEYHAFRVQVTHIYYDEFPVTAEIIDPSGSWGRESSTVGTHDVAGAVNGRTWATYDFDINGNTAAVTATTNTWFVQSSADNSVLVNAWHPAAPGELRTAYSLLVHHGDCWGPSTVGVEDVELDAHMLIFPNPANDILNVHFSDPHGTDWQLDVIDPLGRVILSRADLVMAKERISPPIAHLSRGTYCLCLSKPGQSHAARSIKH